MSAGWSVAQEGSYFTKEIAVAKASIIVVKARTGWSARSTTSAATVATSWCGTTSHEEVRAPAGSSPASTTPGGSALEGDLTFVQQEEEFFDLDKAIRPQAGALRSLGRLHLRQLRRPGRTAQRLPGCDRQGPGGLPVREMTEVYSYKAEINSNWKLFIDAFAEFYHAPVLHVNQATREEAEKLQSYGFEALHYDLQGQHGDGVVLGRHGSAEGPQHGQADRTQAAQRAVRAVGPPRHRGPRSAAAGREPRRGQAMGRRLVHLVPQLHAADLGPGLVPDLPLLAHLGSATPSRPACTSCRRRPPATGWARSLRQSPSRSTRCRTPIPGGDADDDLVGLRHRFPLNDQEILLRHLHKTARDKIKEYENA